MTKWVTKKLGDLGYSFSGLSGKTINDFGGGKPFIPYMNIFLNGKIDPHRLEYVHIEANEHQNKVEQGDWFFTTSSETPEEVGMTSVLVDDIGEAYLNSFCFGFRLYNKDAIDAEFASYLFRTKEMREKISLFAQGSTRYNLPKQQMFEKLYISFPESLAEQRRIAAILSSADKVIATIEALIEKYKHIKQGMLTDLLQPKEGWKKVKLGEVGSLVTGLTYSPSNVVDEGVLVLRSSNIQNDKISLEDNVYVNVTEYNAVQCGDVLICVRNGSRALIGKTARINKEVEGCAFGAFMAVYRSEHNDFLYHFFKSDYFVAQVSKNIGATINSINGSDLKEMEVYLPYKDNCPDLAEQRRIASILSSIDAKILAEEKVVEKYKGVKKGLMERMMKGE